MPFLSVARSAEVSVLHMQSLNAPDGRPSTGSNEQGAHFGTQLGSGKASKGSSIVPVTPLRGDGTPPSTTPRDWLAPST